jgi:hypothetical protein
VALPPVTSSFFSLFPQAIRLNSTPELLVNPTAKLIRKRKIVRHPSPWANAEEIFPAKEKMGIVDEAGLYHPARSAMRVVWTQPKHTASQKRVVYGHYQSRLS